MIGKTDTTFSTAGNVFYGDGSSDHTRNGLLLQLNRTTTDGEHIRLLKDGSSVGGIGVNSGDQVYFAASDGMGIKVDTDNTSVEASNASGADNDNAVNLGSSGTRWKDLYLSGGVYLGGTGSANKLDDVEYGTYSLADASSGNLTFTVRYAVYKKVGQLVHVEFDIDYPSTANGANARITIPFTTNVTYFSGIVGWSNNAVPIKIHGASSGAYFMDCGNSGGGHTHVTNANLSAKRLIGSFNFCAT
jgi:hypothetical protein